MKTKITAQPHHFVPDPLDNKRLAHLCGPMDENLRQISAALDVTVFRRGERFIVSGENAQRAIELLEQFYHIADNPVSVEDIQLALVEQRASEESDIEEGEDEDAGESSPVLKTKRSDLRGRTPHQNQYIKSILGHDVTFGVGPAGTGKTYLAVACAVDALERDAVKRIVLTRPAVEAGERLGFLPGDLAQKVDPYLRPLYDALYDLLGFDRTQKMFEKQVIEIAPLAYMRGRTLNHAFVILDEAQNTTPEQMKMFLTRIGFGSKAVITGDVTQIDLQRTQKSGLVDAVRILKNVRGIAFTHSPARTSCGIRWSHASSMRMQQPMLPRPVPRAMPQKNSLSLSVQYPDARLKEIITRQKLRRWIQAALFAPAELTIRLVDAEEGQALNREYRGKDYATNVLTFAYTEDEASEVTQADIILCTDVLQREAEEQKKSVESHAAHLVVHGVLHAQGYDHETDEEATEMEQLEVEILAKLGEANPYS